MNKKKIAVRYCGGCNPRYDRTAAVRQLADLFPECEFAMFQVEQAYQAAIVVCGCPVRCAGTSDLHIPPDRLAYLTDIQNLNAAAEKLTRLLAADDRSLCGERG